MLDAVMREWGGPDGQGGDLWIFAYASLIWRPEFDSSLPQGVVGCKWLTP